MPTFDVLVWEDSLSDGSVGYSAWCSYVLGVSGQGYTEDEALADITKAMVDIITEPWDDGRSLEDVDTAAADMANLLQELVAEDIPHRMHKVSLPVMEPAGD